MNESLLLTSTPVITFQRERSLTNASGFFFQRDDELYLVTSRHVLIDAPSTHFPDRIEFEVHTDAENLAKISRISVLLYENGKSSWRDGLDAGGAVDVAVIKLERSVFPDAACYFAFTTEHLLSLSASVEIGTPLLVVGFPMGFHDSLHHLPVVRQAALASSFGFRFKGQGYFLTDARTHRGMSGAPVVARSMVGSAPNDLSWTLLGIHSSRLDAVTRDVTVDEALGLNCSWYADILLILTASS